MKSINYLYCRLYPSSSSITNTVTSEFVKINFCSKMLLQLRDVNPANQGYKTNVALYKLKPT